MKIFIDFDDVIFNTKKFKHDFKSMFVDNDISEEIFDKYYNDPNDQKAIKTFDPWKQIERINEEIKIDVDKLKNLVREYISDMSGYVFEDVADFVKSIGKENICIVSFGELEFQTKKILNSGIKKYIKNIKITDGSKAKEIYNFLENEKQILGEKVFFIEDRVEQICAVKKENPEIITIFLKRPEGRYQEMIKENCCDYEVHNLIEAQEIIFKIIK